MSDAPADPPERDAVTRGDVARGAGLAGLSRAGYRIVEAGSAREALSAMQIDKPDAVLLDLGLPDRDGLELVPLIKGSGAAVLVISARDATDQKVAARGLSAS